MPKEYYGYMYLFEEEDVKGYCNRLKYVLSLPKDELLRKGEEAKEFVLKKKNNVLQSGRVLNLIK